MTDPVSFADLGLSPEILSAVADSGYTTPTPIQAAAIPHVLMGRDVLGCAQTGTGKTASFTLPMIDILSNGRARARMPRSLILTPTRELAAQISDNFNKYGKNSNLSMALLVGGVSMGDQVAKLDRGVDVLIATPGRLMDLFDRGKILMSDVKLLVIDECDRMLDMGFIPDVERIVSLLPKLRQTLMFSATLAPEIRRLADVFLMNPREISVAAPASTAVTVTQFLAVVGEEDKREALRRLIKGEEVKNAFIFCNRKRDVDILYKSLKRHEFSVGALHGDMVQSVRTETLDAFKNDRISLLVCSDVAARGLDIQGVSHVFNFDVPFNAEDYVHRIGRTGRAGRAGRAFTLATQDDGKLIESIEQLISQTLDRIDITGVDSVEFEDPAERKRRGRGKPDSAQGESGGRGGRGRGRGRGGEDRGPREDRQPREARDDQQPREAREERQPREDRPQRDERGPREDRQPREERQARDDRQPREERQPREDRRPRDDRQPREDRRPREDRNHRDDRQPREAREDRQPREDRSHRDDRWGRGDRDRSRGRRDHDDLGPSVLGFGDEMPAFVRAHVERLARGERLEAGGAGPSQQKPPRPRRDNERRRRRHEEAAPAATETVDAVEGVESVSEAVAIDVPMVETRADDVAIAETAAAPIVETPAEPEAAPAAEAAPEAEAAPAKPRRPRTRRRATATEAETPAADTASDTEAA